MKFQTMIDSRIMKKLIAVNDEEQAILRGKGNIDRSLYMSGGNDIVKCRKLLESGKLITLRKHTRFVDFPTHTHDYVEVVYMCSGSTEHIVNGSRIILREGELLFLSQHARQKIKKAGRDDIAVNFIVLPQFFDGTLSIMGDEDTPLKKFITDCLCADGGSGYLHFAVSDILPVQNLVENMIWTLTNETRNKRKINRASMELLFLQLLSCTDRLTMDGDGDVIIQVLQYIEDNYSCGTLEEIAEKLHRNVYWMSREIKRKTGKNYTELVQDKRLSQAVFYLKNTEMKISDTAAAVGYENISYFHRIFRQAYGMSPRQYRINSKCANKDTFLVKNRPLNKV